MRRFEQGPEGWRGAYGSCTGEEQTGEQDDGESETHVGRRGEAIGRHAGFRRRSGGGPEVYTHVLDVARAGSVTDFRAGYSRGSQKL